MRARIAVFRLLACFLVAGFVCSTTPAWADGVVEPQLFTKAKRLEIAPFFAYVGDDPWVSGYIPGAAVTYHLTEHTAVDFTTGAGLYTNKSLYHQVEDQVETPPELVTRPRFFVTGNGAWSPIYGKLNLLAEMVIHYDLFVVGGGGIALEEIEQNDQDGQTLTNRIFPVIDVGVGQRFFMNDWFAVRLDVRPYIFLEVIDGRVIPKTNTQIVFGASFMM